MGIRNFPVHGITPGKRIFIGGPTWVSIPTLPGGILPKFLKISVERGTAAGNIIFIAPRIGAGAGLNTFDFPLWADDNDGITLNVHGYDYIRCSRIGDNTSIMNFIPLTDF
jgi:hypothetical protein